MSCFLKRNGRKLLAALIFIAVLLVYFLNQKGEGDYSAKYAGLMNIENIGGIGREDTYAKYMEKYAEVPAGTETAVLDLLSYTQGEGVSVLEDYEGEGSVIQTESSGFVEYEINLAQEGLYNIYIEYYPVKSRGNDMERCLYINGAVPFTGADTLVFHRVWGDASAVKQDNQGNDIRPSQIEKPCWESSYFRDSLGYYTEPYSFYFRKGINTLRLESVNEPMIIRRLELKNAGEMKDYDGYITGFDLSQYKNENLNFISIIQGEGAPFRSSPSLYASYDRSSPNTVPYSTSLIKLNMIGGFPWRVSGQWIEWEAEVPDDGLYRISIKARQNYNRGFVSNRSLMIDGQIPFDEVSVIPFQYDNEWKLLTLGNEAGKAYLFPLTKGKHSIRLEVTMGELGSILTMMEDSIFRLNEIYRKILVLTGAEPDKYRDYRIDTIYPEVIKAMEQESKILYSIVDQLVTYSGQKGAEAGTVQTLAKQLEKFAKRPDKIPPGLQNFKDNISNFGNSMNALSQGSLDIDYLVVSAEGAELLDVNETFADKAVHETRSFVSSFFVDYNKIGNIYQGNEAIDVWMLSGRDQSTILKTMIDDTFTPETGISVNVKLVTQDALMPAVVAGTGPDVALTVNQGDPVNYAIRNAAMDISGMKGFNELASQYYESALVPFRYDGGMYGMPETQIFNVMFYRKDIFEELKLTPPDTWEDFIAVIPTIQKSNMNVGIPSVERRINNVLIPDLSNFFAQLYQRGGTLYNENGSKVLLDNEISVEAFEKYTEFFTQYKLPMVYDFVNRFRTGEMPLGIADYNTYNTLVVFAPEIRGLWDFTLIPGTLQEDGQVNRATSSYGSASMILANTQHKDAAWEFLKWWESSEAQVRFGRELEAVMGASARYPTANKIAFDQLSWNYGNAATLKEQWQWVTGTPEVPGGYYTARHIINAVRKVISKNEDARETLLDYTRTINEELEKKRIEFGLKN